MKLKKEFHSDIHHVTGRRNFSACNLRYAGLIGLTLAFMVPVRAHAGDAVPVISADGQIKSVPVMTTEGAQSAPMIVTATPAARTAAAAPKDDALAIANRALAEIEAKPTQGAPALPAATADSMDDTFVAGRAMSQKSAATAIRNDRQAADDAPRATVRKAANSAIPGMTPIATMTDVPGATKAPVAKKLASRKKQAPVIAPVQTADADMEVTITLPNGRAPVAPTAAEGQGSADAGQNAPAAGNANVADGTKSGSGQMALMDAVDVQPKLANDPATAEPINKAVFDALENHPLIKGRKATAQARDHEVKAERSNYFPVLSVDAYTGWHDTENDTTRALSTGDDSVDRWESEGEVRMRQLVWDFGVTNNRVDAAKSREAEAGADVQDGQETIALRAAESYLDVLRALENLDLARTNVAKHEKTLSDVQLKEKAGAGDGGDVAQTASRVALAQAFQIQYEEALQTAQANFREAVGYLPAEMARPQLPEIVVPPSVDDAITDAYRFNNSLRSAAYRVEAFEHDTDAEHDTLFPRLDVDVSHSRGEDTDIGGGTNEDTRALLRLSWNLPTGGEKFARRDRASNLRLAAAERMHEIQRQVEQDVRVAYADVKKTGERLEPLKQRVTASETVVDAYRQQFEAGRRTLLDTLDAENELFLARVAETDGEYEYLRAHYRLFAASGRLREALGITR